MNFDKKQSKLPTIIGYLFSFFLFTTILFFILKYTNKFQTWTYFHIIGITSLIIIIGGIFKKLLK